MFTVHKITSKNLTAMRSVFSRVNQVRTDVYLLGDEPGLQEQCEWASGLCAEKERSLWKSHLQEGEVVSMAQPQAGTEVLSTTGRHRGLFHQISRRCQGHTATLFGDPQISMADARKDTGHCHCSRGPNSNSINST